MSSSCVLFMCRPQDSVFVQSVLLVLLGFSLILPKPLLLLFPRNRIPFSILTPFSFSKSLGPHTERETQAALVSLKRNYLYIPVYKEPLWYSHTLHTPPLMPLAHGSQPLIYTYVLTKPFRKRSPPFASLHL